MSVLRPYFSRRGRLALVASVLLLLVLLAAPGVSFAKPPASVKLFRAAISPTTATGNMSGSWTETVHNCGPSDTSPCTLASTIGLAVVQIGVPSAFQTNDFSVSISSASGHSWTATYNSSTHVITASAVTGSDKLQAGESVGIQFNATLSSCATGSNQFPTQAWGDFTFSDQFTVAGTTSTVANPTVTITGCALTSGGEVTGPNGTSVTGNDFTGTVIVSFGGDLSCGDGTALGTQWQSYHLPDQVNIDPNGATATSPKTFTFKFSGTADSSWYLICYGTPNASFTTRGGGTSPFNTAPNAGLNLYVGLLPDCYTGGGAALNDPPCVDLQYRDFSTNKIVISIRVPPGDPNAK